jgi:two-component system, chemotaxis family, CheB/CheR fusion protein
MKEETQRRGKMAVQRVPVELDHAKDGARGAGTGSTGRPPHLIVGIGASAGGLEAFRTFFENMPTDSGLAFVLVQHLAPDRKSMLAEILGKSTSMAVTEAVDGAEVVPDRVYVIPPDATLSIANGRLVVVKPAPPRDHRRPIDTFLFSLAQDQNENAVCVILSGTGSDGALGLTSIKEHGGLTIAQAEFDQHAKSGMPSSAAATGFVDHVLQVKDIPSKLIEYHHHLVKAKANENADGIREDAAQHLGEISALLRKAVGHDFTDYKDKTLLRRIQRRMQVLQLPSATEYLDELRANPQELQLLFRDLLIGVTQFFRDPLAFDALQTKIIPNLVAGKGAGDQLRVWVPGCATGEEAYSIAILIMEAVAKSAASPKIMVFATDIDDRALTLARSGRYPRAHLDSIPSQQLERWFVRDAEHYCVSAEIRELCVFSAHSVVRDPPFSKLDLISCRNLLIYLDAALQDRLIPIFHYALRPGGFLFLGPSESLTRQEAYFAEVDKKHRLFERRNETPTILPSLPLSQAASKDLASPANIPTRKAPETAIERGARRVMERYAPAHLIVDKKHQVLSFSGQTGKYLDPQPGAASFNLFNLIQKALRTTARSLLQKAESTGLRAMQENVPIEVGGKSETITLIVEPILPPSGRPAHYVVVFQEIETSRAPKEESGANGQSGAASPELESELRAVKARLQAALDEAEQANEDLKSVNEEHQSLNEELQSSNEELETSKEEMQSINEELQTVNNELNEKNTTLHRLNSDLHNLLESTQIAILFIDEDLSVRSFTPACTKLFHLRETDRGRPITEIASRLTYRSIEDDVRESLVKLSVVERELQGRDGGATFLMRIRPYRTLNCIVDGVVITFVDITEQKRHEEALGRLAAIVASSDDAIIGHSLDGTITSWNRSAQAVLGSKAEEMIGKHLSTLMPQGGIADIAEFLKLLQRGEQVPLFEIAGPGKDGVSTKLSLSVSPVRDGEGRIIAASTIARDVSERARAEQQRTLLMAELDHRVKNTLATVHSIAAQTARNAASLEEFVEIFEGRLLALSQTHNLLTEGHWRGVSLRQILAAELSPYSAIAGDARFALDGEDISLSPAQALSLGMAFHELTTNAVKYGAFSSPAGSLNVTWVIDHVSDQPWLRLKWVESGGPPVMPRARSGFGSRLLERGLPNEAGGEVSLEFASKGVRCIMSIPIKRPGK